MSRFAVAVALAACCLVASSAGCASPPVQVPDAEQLASEQLRAYERAFAALSGGEPEIALREVEPLAAIVPWHVPSHVLRQDAMIALGRNEAAREWYGGEAERHPDDGRRVLLAGRLADEDGDARETAYRRALALEPDSVWPSIGLVYELLRRADRAAAEVMMLGDRGFPDEAAEAAGRRHAALVEAERRAREVVAGRVRLAAGHAALASTLLARAGERQEGRDAVAEAVKSAKGAAALDPGNPAPWALLALAHRAAHEDAAAAEALRQALDLRPGDPVLLGNLGRVELDLGRPGDARDTFEQAVEAAPDDPLLVMNLGIARHRTGDVEGALSALDRACRIAGRDPRPYEAYALVLAESGDRPAAVLAMSRYLDLGGPARASARRFIEEMAAP